MESNMTLRFLTHDADAIKICSTVIVMVSMLLELCLDKIVWMTNTVRCRQRKSGGLIHGPSGLAYKLFLLCPSTDPWAKLHSIRTGSDSSTSTHTVWYMSVRYDVIQENWLPGKRKQCWWWCSNYDDLWCEIWQINQAKRTRKQNLDQETVECHFVLWVELTQLSNISCMVIDNIHGGSLSQHGVSGVH